MKSGKFVCLVVCPVVCLIAALAWATSAPAQTMQRGEIRGVVYDSSHGVVPSAKVTIFNPSTGYKREMTTDASGSYAFAQLLPGVYQITAVAQGFAPITLTDINIQIGASLSLDVTLPVKGQTTSVTVTATTGPVDTTTAGINQIINQRNVENLPLAGRDYRDLAQLSSSAEVVPGLRGGIRMGGQQSDYSELTIDGQDSFNNFFGEFFGSLETKNFTIPLESVQEFQVVTNGFAPEFGRATGGLINVVTKSGTNEWHGTAHYNALAGAMAAEDALHEPLNIDLRQQFGGTVGFPIHKNTQFLFLATDIQRSHGPLVSQFCTPGPDQAACVAALNASTGPGVFFNCMPGACGPGQVPIPANVSPATGMLPPGCGKPAAGDSVLKDCYGVSNLGQLLGSHPQFNNFYTVLGHWDWQMTPSNHFSIRGYGTRNHTDGFNGAAGQNEIPNGFSNTENFINQGISGVFALNTVLGKKVNEIRVSIQGETRKRKPNSTSPALSVSDSSPTACPDGKPCLNIGAPFSTGVGERFYLPINNDNGKFEAADNFQFSFGKHDIKFGGNVNAFVDRKDSFVGWAAGEYDFFSLADFNSTTPSFTILNEGIGLGGLSPGLLGPASTVFPNYQTDLGLYWQDKWQVTPRFTLTYGLRWDGTWNPQPQTPLVGNTVLLGVGSGTHAGAVPQRVPNDFEQFGPRIGMAWNAITGDHPTIIRASWGLYYAQAVEGIFFPTGGGGKLSHCFVCPTPAAGFPYILPNVTTLQVNQLCGTIFGCPAASSGGGYVDPQFKNPRVSNFTVGVEHTLARDLTVTVTYAFVHSGRLRTGGYDAEESWQRNYIIDGTDQFGRSILGGTYTFVNGVNTGVSATPLDPTISFGTTETASFSHGNFHEVVVNFTKRFSNHFQVFGNYIWSRNKDNASSERDTDTYFGAQDPVNINLDYGRNGLDITHQFKAAGVYDFPWGFTASSSVIVHTGVPYPLYIAQDITGQGESNNGHEADRPTFTFANGTTALLGRYPFDQPGFANWDARIAKDIPLHERYHVQLQADFFNVTNRGNVYSNPDIHATISLTGCTSRPAPVVAPGFTGTANGPMGLICPALTPSSLQAARKAANYGAINQIAPGSTPFAFQAGAKFTF